MTYVRFDDHFPQHRKLLSLSDSAFALYVRGICYSSTQLSDGAIPAAALPILSRHRKPLTLVDELVLAEVWEPSGNGWQVHDYLDWQTSRDEVEATREVARRRWSMNANPDLTKAIRKRDGDSCRYCGQEVNWKDRRGPHGGTYDHVLPVSAGGIESVDNLVVSCRGCNLRKGARTPTEAAMDLLEPMQKPARSRQKLGRSESDTTQVFLDTASSTETETEHKAPPLPTVAAPPKKRQSKLPDDWQPSPALLAFAAEKCPGVDVGAQTEIFRDHWRAKGEVRDDWDATFRNWLRRAPQFSGQAKLTTTNGHHPTRSQNQINADIAARRMGLNPADSDPFGGAPDEPWSRRTT